jgi:hypothetical protein
MGKFLIALFCVCSVSAFAYTGTVQKIKGSRGLVEFERNAKVHEGDMVSTETSVETTKAGKFQSREYSLSYTLTYQSNNSSVTGSSSSMNSSVMFGFSFGSFELGPVLGLASTTTTTTVSATSFGFFGHYNFISNKQGVDWVPSVGGKYLTTSSSTLTQSYMGGYASLKWFPIGNNVSFLFLVGFGQTTVSTVTVSNLSFESGPIIYF